MRNVRTEIIMFAMLNWSGNNLTKGKKYARLIARVRIIIKLFEH